MNIPDEVIEKAAKAQFEWQDGLPSWETDADAFTKAEYVSQTHAAAQVIAEWARKETIRELMVRGAKDSYWDYLEGVETWLEGILKEEENL